MILSKFLAPEGIRSDEGGYSGLFLCPPRNKKEDPKIFLHSMQLESDVDPVLCRYYY
jgi:hypothetical protein